MPGINIYYSDTDSLIVDKQLNTGSNLGDLSDELNGGIIEHGIFFGPKNTLLKLKT